MPCSVSVACCLCCNPRLGPEPYQPLRMLLHRIIADHLARPVCWQLRPQGPRQRTSKAGTASTTATWPALGKETGHRADKGADLACREPVLHGAVRR